MSVRPSCCVCFEEFVRDVNPPVSCVPCGHDVCRPCLGEWSATQRGRTRRCPLCRAVIANQMPNRALMDMIEASVAAEAHPAASDVATGEAGAETSDPSAPGQADRRRDSDLFRRSLSGELSKAVETRRHANEWIRDDTTRIVCVVDNSGSMRSFDGKTFEVVQQTTGLCPRVVKRGHGSVTRWEEAKHKCLQVAEYNVRRGVPATYYLLNPRVSGLWARGVDFVEVDANGPDYMEVDDDGCTGNAMTVREAPVLTQLRNMLDPSNVRGSTPLDLITRHLRQQISQGGVSGERICYVLFTDGEPNNRHSFEQELRSLASDIRNSGRPTQGIHHFQALFLTVNLCTDQDDVVEYYNDLDRKLGSELSGMDVLDDLEAEHKEVRSAGNSFVTYCQELHICRMAGCHSILGDLLDERPLGMYHAVKLVKELLRLDMQPQASDTAARPARRTVSASYDPSLWLEDTDTFIELVNAANFHVFDFLARSPRPLIRVDKLRNKIWWYKFWNSRDQLGGNQLRVWREWCDDSGLTRFLANWGWAVVMLIFAIFFAYFVQSSNALRPNTF